MKRDTQSGVALISVILVLMLMSALLVGFMAALNADQAASGINRDQTQAYAAAHAGVEKLTADLGQLFNINYSPSGAQVQALTANPPVLPGITYEGPNGTAGYRIGFIDEDEDGNPDVENPEGSPITTVPWDGLKGLITPYNVEVTARTTGGAEVRMRRTMQSIGIPVFQFGIFSENDLSFFAGPHFAFGGRVHTNQHLWLKQDTGSNVLTLQDRVTAVGEVIRRRLANGVDSHNGTVRVARAAGCPAAPAAPNGSCRDLAATEGSVETSLGSALNEPAWTNASMGAYNGWIRNGRTGAMRLDLPITTDGASPVDLIRRAPAAEAADSAVARQRFFHMATLRILLSDTPTDITNLPTVVSTPVALRGAFNPATYGYSGMTGAMTAAASFAQSNGDTAAGDRTNAGTSRVDGYISIEMQRRDSTAEAPQWVDVTKEILSLGFVGRRLSNGTNLQADVENACNEPHDNAVIRLQRPIDSTAGTTPGCGGVPAATGMMENSLYDPREGAKRDNVSTSQTALWWSGVMHYVELDVNNLRRWLKSDIGTSGRASCVNGGGTASSCPMDVTGFVVYFSDRRGNRDLGPNNTRAVPVWNTATTQWEYGDDRETGEFGWEDNINTDSNSTPNGVRDHSFVDVQGVTRWAEDVNQDSVLQTYGNVAITLPTTGTYQQLAPPTGGSPAGNNYNLWNTTVDANVARLNRAFFFRRALKLTHGGRGLLPANGSQGLTVAAENPVYIEGNYNACTNHLALGAQGGVGLGGKPAFSNSFRHNTCTTVAAGFGSTPGTDHVSAAVIADSLTLLSNAWNDIRSFVVPHNAGANMGGGTNATANRGTRLAATTWYRLGVIAGKGLNFPRASVSPTSDDHSDFGTDGGAHNFLRFIENWGSWDNGGAITGSTLNYRGSILSFYTARQAVGTYKCCTNVYSAPNRGYNFDVEFLNPTLLPPRTPMFRTINTLTFRQILRPTQ